MTNRIGYCVLMLAGMSCLQSATAEEYLNGIKWEKPKIVTPGEGNTQPPSDATVLFDGKDLSGWKNGDRWPVKDGFAFSGKGQITSNAEFGDCQVHLEWSAPTPAKGSGQGRGNSGLFLMGKYEIQILDSYENETYFDGQAGAIYKQTPPAANVNRPPGEWNTYDVYWTAPRFEENGDLKSPAYITAVINGVLVLNHFELEGDTPYNRPPAYKKHGEKGPISLQDHGNPVRFRNIWVREFSPAKGVQERPPYIKDGDKETPIAAAGEGIKPEDLVGTWEYVAGWRDGGKVDNDRFAKQNVEFTKDQLTLNAQGQDGEAAKFVLSYKIDNSTTPKKVALEITESPFGGGVKADGIIKMEDGKLTICYPPMGGDAPKDFESEGGFHMFQLEKK